MRELRDRAQRGVTAKPRVSGSEVRYEPPRVAQLQSDASIPWTVVLAPPADGALPFNLHARITMGAGSSSVTYDADWRGGAVLPAYGEIAAVDVLPAGVDPFDARPPDDVGQPTYPKYAELTAFISEGAPALRPHPVTYSIDVRDGLLGVLAGSREELGFGFPYPIPYFVSIPVPRFARTVRFEHAIDDFEGPRLPIVLLFVGPRFDNRAELLGASLDYTRDAQLPARALEVMFVADLESTRVLRAGRFVFTLDV